MPMRVTVDGAKKILDGLWRAKLSPCETGLFGPSDSRHGDWSVIAVAGPVHLEENASLSFDPSAARLLNVGATEQAIILATVSESAEPPQPAAPVAAPRGGDAHFLENLPSELRSLGEALLSAIRSHFAGQLRFHPKSRKYVETPDNFWTVTIQPRVRALQITIRGEPESFSKPRHVELKHDMKSYSAFKLRSEQELSEALSIIRQAGARGRRGAVAVM